MELSAVRNLKIGTHVICKLDGSTECSQWFTGKVLKEVILNPRGYLYLRINRDDFSKFDSWNIFINESNKHLIELVDFEWNEEENI